MSDHSQRGQGSGVQNTGSGMINITTSAIGDRATVYAGQSTEQATQQPVSAESIRSDVGIITVLSEETIAVADMLAAAGYCHKRTHSNGLRFYEADIEAAGRDLKVVATQAMNRGQRSTVIAFHNLQQYYRPTVTVLVGIGGGIHPSVDLGDVVIVQEVIYYDMRKETQKEVTRRGQSRPVPAAIRHAINDFFSSYGEPYHANLMDRTGITRNYIVLPGPIGTGEAVVAYQDSDIRKYISEFNDKTLALETEAGGIAEAFYETADISSVGSGWLAIRGISDRADTRKDDAYHEIASWHAAAVLKQLLPYLIPPSKPH